MLSGRLAQIGLLLLTLVGCRALTPSVVQPPGRAHVVKPAVYEQQPAGPPRVLLEIVFASRPLGDRSINEAAWQTADEAILSLELQERLRSLGFRVGVLSGQPPESIDMILRETPEGILNGHRLSTVSGKATAVMVATYKECPETLAEVLDAEPDQIQAPRCLFSVLPTVQSDGSVQLYVTPAVQYGSMRRRFVPEFGPGGVRQWTLEITPNEKKLADVTWSVQLRPDEYLLIGCYPEDESKLGAVFLVDRNSTPPRQMLVLIRAESVR